MDDHLPFLHAIAANPADDLPRLVFADFLEESGEPDALARAHFIRAQIALTQLPPGGAEFRETVALQNRLFAMYSEDWIWDLPEHHHAEGNPAWRRGFIEFLRMNWQDMIRVPELFETVPITRLQIYGAVHNYGTAIESLGDAEHLRRITHLQIGPSMRPDALDSDSPDSPGILEQLLWSRCFRSLSRLDLSANNINGSDIAAFVFRIGEAAFAPTLESLDLSELHGLDDAVGNALATARGLESLGRLDLRRTGLSEPVRAMLRRRFGDRLTL